MTGFTSTPAAPPTAPDPNAVVRRSLVWPTVIGILSIVFGGGGVLLGLVGLVTWIAMSGATFPGANTESYQAATMALQAIYLLLAVLLLVGGILMLMKRRRAVACLLVWAWLKIAYGVAYGVVNGLVQQEMFQSMAAANPGPSPAVQTGMTTGVAIGTLVFSVLWNSAFPVFLLIWFARRKIKLNLDDEFLPPRGASGA